MDNRKIGVFDSGLGGLTAMKELKKILPNEDIIYFGDTGRVPYGTRSKETIIKYTRQDISFLTSFHIKAALAACGTISSVALETVKGDYNLPIVGVIKSAALAAKKKSKTSRIGVCATPGTIASGAYEKALLALDPALSIKSIACPFLVPMVESGRFRKDDPVARIVIPEYFSAFSDFGIDTLILGCTHYPLLEDIISEFFEGKVTLINSGLEAALSLKELLSQNGLLSDRTSSGSNEFFVSDDVYDFSRLAGNFLGCDISSEVKKIDIENY